MCSMHILARGSIASQCLVQHQHQFLHVKGRLIRRRHHVSQRLSLQMRSSFLPEVKQMVPSPYGPPGRGKRSPGGMVTPEFVVLLRGRQHECLPQVDVWKEDLPCGSRVQRMSRPRNPQIFELDVK